MGQTPEEIRVEIEKTRTDMSETVEALGRKADLPGRMMDAVESADIPGAVSDALTSAAEGAGDVAKRVSSRVGGIVGADTSRTESRDGATGRSMRLAQENPVGLAVAGAALGLIVGLLLPATRTERRRLGPAARDLRQQATGATHEAVHDAVERGRVVVREAGEEAMSTMRERGREEGSAIASDLADRVQAVRERTT